MAGLMEYDPNMERPEAPLLSRLGPFNFAEKYNADMQRYGQNQMYGLIDQYSQPRAGVLQMTPDNLALSDSIYGRQERQFTPNADFYMRASTIPGFTGLATGMQSQQGAMDRQVQEQGWSVNPVSNQAQQNAREQQRLVDQQAQQIIANKNAAQQLAISGGHLALAQKRFDFDTNKQNTPQGLLEAQFGKPEANHMWVNTPDGLTQTPIQGTTKWREGRSELDTIDSGIQGLTKLKDHYSEYGTFEMFNRPKAKQAEVWRQQAITAMGTLSNMGVLQPGDLDRLTKQLADPTSFDPTTGNAGAISAVEEVNQRLAQARESRIRSMPSLYRKPPEPPK